MASAAKSVFAQMEEAVGIVSAAKQKLDAASAAVQAAAAEHQDALKAAEAIHKAFSDAVGAHIPSARVR